MLFVCSVSWLFLLGCQYQCKWLTIGNDSSPKWPITGTLKPYSPTQSLLNGAVQHETLYRSGRTSLVRVRQIQAYTHQRSEIVACSWRPMTVTQHRGESLSREAWLDHTYTTLTPPLPPPPPSLRLSLSLSLYVCVCVAPVLVRLTLFPKTIGDITISILLPIILNTVTDASL